MGAEPLGRLALFGAEQMLAASDDFIHADRKTADDHRIRPEAPNGVDQAFAFGKAVEAPGAATGRVTSLAFSGKAPPKAIAQRRTGNCRAAGARS